MKDLKEMSRQELLDYFKEKKSKGASYGLIFSMITKNKIDSNTKKWIFTHLFSSDKASRLQKKILLNKQKRANALTHFFIGMAIMTIGYLMYRESVQHGVVFIFNILLFGSGILLIIKSLISIISTYLQKKS